MVHARTHARTHACTHARTHATARHGTAGLYSSAFDEALIVSYDGGGNEGAFLIYKVNFVRAHARARASVDFFWRVGDGKPEPARVAQR